MPFGMAVAAEVSRRPEGRLETEDCTRRPVVNLSTECSADLARWVIEPKVSSYGQHRDVDVPGRVDPAVLQVRVTGSAP